ncbi:MAG: hypothetical protein GDA48_28315 [Hormoscilla sp. GM102CHS1]|nr:hypothetical protein [Hormoscilla sp. GM102CHS1]
MKQQILSEEQVAQLADSLELAKTIELQAKQLSEMIEAFALKYERRLVWRKLDGKQGKNNHICPGSRGLGWCCDRHPTLLSFARRRAIATSIIP